MKQLKVPFIEGLEKKSFEQICLEIETKGAKAHIDTVCWPADFPYFPDATFSIARTASHLVIVYHVRGLDLRAAALQDNGNVWEDSCCEFFVSDPTDGTYYNFEMNCIGTLLGSKRKSREDFVRYSEEDLQKAIRYSSLEKKAYDESGKIFSWDTAICIPLKMMGISPDNVPGSIRANFYKCGDLTAHPHFLSWNPVLVEKPDFHRPDFFGELIFD